MAQQTKDKIFKQFLDAFYRHLIIFEPYLKVDKISLEFSGRHETIADENRAIMRVNPKDSVFQDTDVIAPFICQELIRIKIRQLEVPRFIEDIICGREVVKLYPKEYFQLCYLGLLKYRKLSNLQDFLDASKYWVLFYPIDSYNSDFLRDVVKRACRDRRLETLCTPLFSAAKSSLSSSEKLKNAVEAYENLMEHADS